MKIKLLHITNASAPTPPNHKCKNEASQHFKTEQINGNQKLPSISKRHHLLYPPNQKRKNKRQTKLSINVKIIAILTVPPLLNLLIRLRAGIS